MSTRLLLFVLILITATATSTCAAELSVPSQYSSVQAAIDAAQTGDTIVVQPGTYTENINFHGKAITLTSTDPLDPSVVANTVIDGDDKGSVVTFNSQETTDSVLTGFTIRNGSGTLLDGKLYGGGIFCGTGCAPTIRHNHIVDNTADVGAGLYTQGNSPTITNIAPASGVQGTTVQATIAGHNLASVTGVSFSGTGVTATIQAGKTEDSLPVQITIAQNAAPGNRGIVLTTPEAQFNTLATFEVKALPSVTADPTSLNLIVGQTGDITLGIPDPAPAGGLTIVLSSSAPIVATVPASATVPEGQKTVQVTVTAVGYGTTTITANAAGYTKAQVPVTVVNPPLVTFSPSPLSVAVGLVERCTLNVSNPAPVGGLVVNLAGGDGKVEFPVSVTIAETRTSATFNVIGIAQGATTISGTATGYPLANLQVNVTPATFNLFPSYLPVAVGRSSTLVLSIPSFAPAGGLTVNLASGNASFVTVPATITIPEGERSAFVAVNGVGVGSAAVTASLAGFQNAQATVNVLQDYNISFVPGSLIITPGTSKTTDVVVSSLAPEGGLTIALTNPSPDKVSVPATVSIPQGQFYTTISVGGSDTTDAPVDITASCSGLTDGHLSVTVQPKYQPWLVADVTVGAGCQTTGGVGLTEATAPAGGYTVNLTSNDPTIASVPATVTIPEGSSSVGFTIVGKSVGTTQIVLSLGGFSATSTVTVVKPTFSFQSMPSQMTVGAGSGGSIYTYVPNGSYCYFYYGNGYIDGNTSQAVDQALTVSLSSENPAVIQVPATVTISAGSNYQNFNIQAVGTGTSTLTGSATGWDSQTSSAITTVGPWLVADVTVGAGCQTTGGVGLTEATAPAGGYTVNLTSDDPAIASVPATVTIPEGSSSVGFTIVGKSVGTTQIMVSVGGFSATSTVTVVKPTFSFQYMPSQMTVGAGSGGSICTYVPNGSYCYFYYGNGYIDGNTSQAVDQALTVSLSSENPAVIQVPATVTIPAGSYYQNFSIQAVGTGSSTVTASATGWDSKTSDTIQVNPAGMASLPQQYRINTAKNPGRAPKKTSASATARSLGSIKQAKAATSSGGGIPAYLALSLIMSPYAEAAGTGSLVPIIECNVFSGNVAGTGGGIACYSSSPIIRNNIFVNNTATGEFGGGAIAVFGSSTPTLTGNTVCGNNATSGNGGGIYAENAGLSAKNSILLENQDDLWNCTATYSCVTDLLADPGTGNISADPLFVQTSDPASEGYFRLGTGSSCIDQGDPTYASVDGETDIDGDQRIIGGRVDIGADESPETIPPVVQIISGPIDPTPASSLPVTFCWSATDDTTPANEIRYSWRVDGGEWSAWSTITCRDFDGLSDGPHTLRLRAIDQAGNVSYESIRHFGIDTTGPVISAVQNAAFQNRCTITWTTNEPATSQISYGVTALDQSTTLVTSLVASHSVTLTNLIPGTAYRYVVKSMDAVGNESVSPESIFTTVGAPDLRVTAVNPPEGDITTDTPFIIKWTVVNASDIATSASWKERVYLSTDNVLDDQDIMAGEFQIGGGLGAGQSSERTQEVTLNRTGLVDGQPYHFIVATDADNKVDEGANESNNWLASDPRTVFLKPDSLAPDTIITSPHEGDVLCPDGIYLGVQGTDDLPVSYLTFQYRLNGAPLWMDIAYPGMNVTLPAGNFTAEARAIDASGNIDPTPAVCHFKVSDLPPVISNLHPENLSVTGATIVWNTDLAATSMVEFRQAAGGSWTSTPEYSQRIKSHAVQLGGLVPDTDYEIRVTSTCACGKTAVSGSIFIRTAVDNAAPETSIISPRDGGSVKSGNVAFQWSGADNATPANILTFKYRLDSEAWSVPSTQTQVSLAVSGPDAHTFSVAAIDGSGNEDPTPASITFYLDDSAPQITGPTVDTITFSSAVVRWTSSEPTIGTVQCAVGSGDFTLETSDTNLDTSHAVVVSNLNSKTQYRVRVLASDEAGNEAQSQEAAFSTGDLCDLSVSAEDFTLSSPSPAVDDDFYFSAKVRNLGDLDASGTLMFYDWSSETGSVLIGTGSFDAIPPTGEAIVTSPTWKIGHKGRHTLWVELSGVNPADNKTYNDRIGRDIEVGAPPFDLSFGISNPKTWPGNVSDFNVVVRNVGSRAQTLDDVSVSGLDWITRVSPLPAEPLDPGDEVQLTLRTSVPSDAVGGPQASPVLKPATLVVSGAQIFAKDFNVEVYTGPLCQLDVTVVDDVTGDPLPQSTIAIDNTILQWTTDSNGQVSIEAVEGERTIFAIAQDYLPASVSVSASSGSRNVLVRLKPGKPLEIRDITVRPLTAQEVQQRGVNLEDPVNYWVYDFCVYLDIEPIPVRNVVLPLHPTPGQTVAVWGGPGGGGGGGGGSVQGSIYYPTSDPTQRVETWIAIPGDIRIMKQFWEATVFVRNNCSPGFDIQNVDTWLDVPAGIGLPDLYGQPQQLHKLLGTLAAGEAKQASWIVRGDVAGKYTLTGRATGDLILGGSTVPVDASLQSSEFEVFQPKLRVGFIAPDTVFANQEFTLRMDITNQSPIPLEGVAVEILAENRFGKLYNCRLSDGEPSLRSIGRLEIDETKTTQFSFVSFVTGRVNTEKSYVVTDPNIQPSLSVVPDPGNRAPVAVDDEAGAIVGKTIWIDVLANDSDPDGNSLAVSQMSCEDRVVNIQGTEPGVPLPVLQTQHGTAQLDWSSGKIKYTADQSFAGSDYFSYRISDGCGGFADATVTIRQPQECISIQEAKKLPDGRHVTLEPAVVTRVFPGVIYVQNGRLPGVMVEVSDTIAPNTIVYVEGTMWTNSGSERCIEATSIETGDGAVIKPMAMTGKNIGGSDYFYTPGSTAGQVGTKAWTWVTQEDNTRIRELVGITGPNNIGLLVRVWGKVVRKDANGFYVDDGSGMDYGDPTVPGLRVLPAPGLSQPDEGDMVLITGISSCYNSGGVCYRMIRATACDTVQ